MCAIDGTSIRLPEEKALTNYFSTHSGRNKQAKCTMGMASVFYDVMNHLVIDSTLQRNKMSERLCAAEHLNFSQKNDLIVYDRGYPAHWLYQLHQQRNIHFCMRLRLSQTIAKDLLTQRNESK